MTSLVLTVLGLDRPGLVESIAQLVASHQGNWIESRMVHLAGHFAGVLRVEVPTEQAAQLQAALATLAEHGLESIVHPDLTPTTPCDAPLVHLDLVGHDRPGIVREVSRVLAAMRVNVEELSTECSAAANSGQPLFRAYAKLRLPPGTDETAVRTALERVAQDLMVDVKLESD